MVRLVLVQVSVEMVETVVVRMLVVEIFRTAVTVRVAVVGHWWWC